MRKKSFYFEDYKESKIIVNNKNANLVKVSLNRVTLLFFVFFSLVFIFGIKIIYLSLYPEKDFSEKSSQNFIKTRGDIVDRNGIIMARSIDIYSAGIRPKLVKNKKKFLINLRLIFPELDSNKIKEGLNNNKFFYIKKRLTEDEKTNLWGSFWTTMVMTFLSPMTTFLFLAMFSAYGVLNDDLNTTRTLHLAVGVVGGAMLWWTFLSTLVSTVYKAKPLISLAFLKNKPTAITKFLTRALLPEALKNKKVDVLVVVNRIAGVAIIVFGFYTLFKAT